MVCAWLYLAYDESLAAIIPDSISGRVMPFNNHGKIIYLTKFSHEISKWSPWIALLLVALGVALDKIKRITKSKSYESRQ